jgi:hypothetical protein
MFWQVDVTGNGALTLWGKVRARLGQLVSLQQARAKQIAAAEQLQLKLGEAGAPRRPRDTLSVYERALALNPRKAASHQVRRIHLAGMSSWFDVCGNCYTQYERYTPSPRTQPTYGFYF